MQQTFSEQNPCSHSLRHLSSPWLNSSWPTAHTSEKRQSLKWFWHSCQKPCYGYETRWNQILDSSTLSYWTIYTISITTKYPPTLQPLINFVVPFIKRHTQCAAAAVIKALVPDQLGNCRNSTFHSKFSLTWQGTPLYGTLTFQAFPYTQQIS